MLYEMGKVCQQNRQENANNLHKFKNDVPQKFIKIFAKCKSDLHTGPIICQL